jgi:uncharacterized protein (TIGR03118 family)
MDPFRSRATVTGSVAVLLFPLLLFGCGDGDNNNPPAVGAYQQTNLVADTAGNAPVTDTELVNPWGLARSATSPFWVADNATGVSTLYNGAGMPFPVGSPLIVSVPPPSGASPGQTAKPTGVVFNGTSDFVISQGAMSGPALFIFATEDGTLSGWNQSVSPLAALLTVDNSGDEAIYKGLALASNTTGNYLFATDFHNGKIDVFDREFRPATLSGSFAVPSLPPGFAPFGIHLIGTKLYVTYAMQDDDKEDDVAGPGLGFVETFDTNGNLLGQFAAHGPLNAPWAVTLAPANFGPFSNAILVGNFGDGRINGFDANGSLMGQLANMRGTPIAVEGLWDLSFGNGANAGPTNTLFFTAGTGDEQHGLFGTVTSLSG